MGPGPVTIAASRPPARRNLVIRPGPRKRPFLPPEQSEGEQKGGAFLLAIWARLRAQIDALLSYFEGSGQGPGPPCLARGEVATGRTDGQGAVRPGDAGRAHFARGGPSQAT